jgi:phosphoadenosine phosphosulfate reductase
MNLTMVKKVLLDGSPCGKCAQAEDILKKRGLWDKIDDVVIAEEGKPESPGMKLAAKHGIDLAPFFIVRDTSGEHRVYTRVFEFIKKELTSSPTPGKPNFDTAEAAELYKGLNPDQILADTQKAFGENLALAFSGAEDVVLIDMASKNGPPFRVFSLDTGRLHPETYVYLDTVRNHYKIDIEIFTPDAMLLQNFVSAKGLNSFYRDGHRECCGIRKVEPLKRALEGRLAWVTGLRRDQSPATRSDLVHAELDQLHRNADGEPLIKINPLLDWAGRDVWDYIRTNNVPYNPLHDQGYRSIGCQPCTRPSRPGEHERAARWWWENETKRECGLHA